MNTKVLEYFLENYDMFLEGFFWNVVYTLVGSLIPLLVGVICCFITRKSKIINSIFSWLSLPMECICPVALLSVMWFLVFPTSRTVFLPVVITLGLSFVGYMPARYVTEWSKWKNMLYHGIGLFSTIFKWSFCEYIIGGKGLLRTADYSAFRLFDYSLYLVPLLVSFGVLLVLEIARRLIKQLMK